MVSDREGWVEVVDRWVVVDVETTGLSPGRDRIIEIGAVAGEGGKITGEFHTLIDAGCPIHWRAQQVHGISSRMLQGQPKPAVVYPEFHRFLGDCSLIAHNAPFDVSFLRHELGLFGYGLTSACHCTLRLCRRHYPGLPNHRLETVARHLFGELPADVRLHRALADARLTARVWLAVQGGEARPMTPSN
ncbi:MAG: 3'-5' exonuclease [Desulfuromonadales bacterium]|nr:3'-5' exonuclease [Desulfuromonadales bacterium]